MVSKRQRRIDKKRANTKKRAEQIRQMKEEQGTEKRERLLQQKYARETRGYVNYSSDLAGTKKSLGIDIEAEVKKLGCRNVLDLGCGDATALRQLERNQKINFFGINFTQEPGFSNLKRAEVKVGEIEELTRQFRPGSMDFAYWNYGIGHSPDYVKALKEISAVLRFQGRLIFNTNPRWLDSKKEMPTLERAIKNAGFKIIRRIQVKYRGMELPAWGREPKIVELPSVSFYLAKTRWR